MFFILNQNNFNVSNKQISTSFFKINEAVFKPFLPQSTLFYKFRTVSGYVSLESPVGQLY